MGEMKLDRSYERGCDAAAMRRRRRGGGCDDRSNRLCYPVSEIVRRPRMRAINPLNSPRMHVETLSVTNEVLGIGPLA